MKTKMMRLSRMMMMAIDVDYSNYYDVDEMAFRVSVILIKAFFEA